MHAWPSRPAYANIYVDTSKRYEPRGLQLSPQSLHYYRMSRGKVPCPSTEYGHKWLRYVFSAVASNRSRANTEAVRESVALFTDVYIDSCAWHDSVQPDVHFRGLHWSVEHFGHVLNDLVGWHLCALRTRVVIRVLLVLSMSAALQLGLTLFDSLRSPDAAQGCYYVAGSDVVVAKTFATTCSSTVVFENWNTTLPGAPAARRMLEQQTDEPPRSAAPRAPDIIQDTAPPNA